MKILVTNDDGIYAPGLWAAVEALKGCGEIFVVAPDREQSGVGTSLTLHAPIRACEIPSQVHGSSYDIKAYSVEGTPADSCVLALERLVGPVDLVVAGINQGSNLGMDVLISGTVGAALQGYVRGYLSIAISVAAVRDTRFEVAASLLRLMGQSLAEGAAMPLSLVVINLPNEPADKIEGVDITHLGGRSYGETVSEGDDRRRKYYWISRSQPVEQEYPKDTDIWAVRHNRISITPIHSDLTDKKRMLALHSIFEGHTLQLLGRSSWIHG